MPIYEYRCESCRNKVSVLLKRMGQEAERCPRCGSSNLVRLYSRFALARSEEDRLERLTNEAALAGVDENDPKSVARMMRRMGQELGEDFPQQIEEMEAGRPEGAEDSGGEPEAGQ
jgi:putative FmdB family regulatory protein